MVIPSLIMTVTMILLIGIIRKTDIKHQIIMARVRTTAGDAIQTTIQANNKTELLVMITLLYLISVLPIGVTVFLMPINGAEYKNNVFDPLRCVFDLDGFLCHRRKHCQKLVRPGLQAQDQTSHRTTRRRERNPGMSC
jgi:hypothetical protein